MAVTIKDNNRIPELIEQLTGMQNRTIEAGILEDGEQAMIAHVHEYGIDIEVTPRMRAYLHHIGIHLRKDTTHIHIPERSFIRSYVDQNMSDIYKTIENLVEKLIRYGNDPEVFFNEIGRMIEGGIKKQLTEVSDPPLSDATIENKGSSNPLVDTGSLLDSISFQVK